MSGITESETIDELKDSDIESMAEEIGVEREYVKYHGSGDPVASVFSPAPPTQQSLIPLALGLRLVSL